MINTDFYKKSIITLKDIRPYICDIHAYFGVPFGDGGFLMSTKEIEEAKKAFDSRFTKMASFFLGIPEEKVISMTKKKSHYDGKPYNWCWKHNKSYDVSLPVNGKPLFSITVDKDRNYFILDIRDSYKTGIGSYYITQNGEIYQDKKSEDLTLDEMCERIAAKKVEEIVKELKKQKAAYNKTKKALATMTKKIKEMEAELESLNNI